MITQSRIIGQLSIKRKGLWVSRHVYADFSSRILAYRNGADEKKDKYFLDLAGSEMQRGFMNGKPFVIIENKNKNQLQSHEEAKRLTKLSIQFLSDEEFNKWIHVLIKASKPELIQKVKEQEKEEKSMEEKSLAKPRESMTE